jgi:hypothetical protein
LSVGENEVVEKPTEIEHKRAEMLASLRVGELRRVTQGAIAGFSLHTAVIFQRVVTIVTASGLDHGALRLDFTAGWNEFKQRIGDEFSLVTGQFTTDDMSSISVVIGR